MFWGSTPYFSETLFALSGCPEISATGAESLHCAKAGITCPSARFPSPTIAQPIFLAGCGFSCARANAGRVAANIAPLAPFRKRLRDEIESQFSGRDVLWFLQFSDS